MDNAANNRANSAPVGIFDSGLGGLSVLRAVRALLPHESLTYCADSRYAPYGERDEAFIVDRSLAIGEWLIRDGAKALVVACNTATTNAIAVMRRVLPVPVIGVEPGIKPAVLASRSRVVAVLATAATLQSAKFQTLLREHTGDCRVICTAGIGLVEAVEAGEIDSPAVTALLRAYLLPMIDAGADTLALGCTHYPFLVPVIESIVGNALHIVDNSAPVALQLARQLHAFNLLADPLDALPERTGSEVQSLARTHAEPGSVRLLSTGNPTQLLNLAGHALNLRCGATTQDIPSARTALFHNTLAQGA